MQDVISELDYQDNRQVPGHSLLAWQINLDQVGDSLPYSPNLDGQQPPPPTMAHYNLQKVPQNFMEDRNEEVNQLINVLNTKPVSQDLIDKIYSQFCDIVKNEMEDKLPRSSPGSHKQPFHKPWWNQELKEARKLVAKAEQEWLKCSNRITRQLLRAQYREVRRKFDSLVRKTKRKWSNKTWGLLDSSLLGGPQTFWKQLRKHTGLGKKKSPMIPMEVIDGQRILSNKEDVLNKWYTDFATLLNTSENPIPSSHTDNASKTEFLPLPNETSTSDMTEEAVPDTIDQDLVKWALLHQKNGKTVGPDGLPAEVIKNQVCCTFFQSLFSACLKNLIIPTVWHHGIITPIPKNKTSDPRIPLNYRGISLLSVPYKAFCSILNQYILEWIEYSGIL